MGGGMTAPLRIAIADDHAIFREGVKSLLRKWEEFVVVGEAERVDDLAPLVARSACDVLILDLQMDRTALAAIGGLAQSVRVLVLTMSERPEDAVAAVRAGASAVVFKRYAVGKLVDALRAVGAGETWLPPAVQAAVVDGLREGGGGLSVREREVVRQVALGQRNAEIARRLLISEETVKKHLNNVFHKLGVRDRVQLTLYAVQHGIVTGHERAAS
jgi:DNA-binding NarL/FixJ family response regulator